MNGYLHKEAIIALQGSGQFGVREAGSRGCAFPRYTRKVWDFHPHRLMKDRSTSPTYGARVDLHILHKVLRLPLLAVASYERLPQRIDYPISWYRSRCCVYFTAPDWDANRTRGSGADSTPAQRPATAHRHSRHPAPRPGGHRLPSRPRTACPRQACKQVRCCFAQGST